MDEQRAQSTAPPDPDAPTCHAPQLSSVAPSALDRVADALNDGTLNDGALLADPPTPAPAGIAGYRISGVIGQGGMGAVYEAEQRHPRRRVALKVIRPGWLSRDMLRRFEHEVEVLGRLQHPGIAQIYEAGTASLEAHAPPQPFFAMELVRGRTLLSYAAENKLGPESRLRLMARICDAVQYAHQKGVIHRDLKPGNILVTDEGQPKILDFGVARATDSDIQTTTLHTDTGQLIGTLPYMSPEQATGAVRELDTRSDVYALGVIAFELLAERLPYRVEGRSLLEAVRIIREEEPSRLSSIHRSLRGDVETIVGKALAKEKDRRYGSAAELGADITRYLNYEPIAARPPSTWYQLRKFARRNKTLVSAAVSIVVALMLGTGAASYQAVRATRAERAALRQEELARRSRAQAEAERDRARAAQRLADDQRELAQKRTGEIRGLAVNLLFDLYRALEDLPGAGQARKVIAETSTRHLELLSADVDKDEPELWFELAAAYDRLAGIRQVIGDDDAAVDCLKRGIALLEQYLESHPHDPVARRNWAVSQHKLAPYLEPNEARRRVERAIAAMEIMAAGPDPKDATQLIADFRATLSRLALLQGDTDRALELSRQIRPTTSPDDQDVPMDRLKELAIAYEASINALHAAGRLDEALAVVDRHVVVLTRLAEADLHSLWAWRTLSQTHSSRGELLLQMERHAEALQAYRRGVETAERLAASEPDHREVQFELAERYSHIGEMLFRNDRHDEAMANIRKGLELTLRLHEKDPQDLRALVGLAADYNNIASLSWQMRRRDDTLPNALKGLDYADRALEVAPDNGTAKTFKVASHHLIARASRRVARQPDLPAPHRREAWQAVLEHAQAALSVAEPDPPAVNCDQDDLGTFRDYVEEARRELERPVSPGSAPTTARGAE